MREPLDPPVFTGDDKKVFINPDAPRRTSLLRCPLPCLANLVLPQALRHLPDLIGKEGDRLARGKRQIVYVRDLLEELCGQQCLVHVLAEGEDPVVLDDLGVCVVTELARDVGGQLRAAGKGVGDDLHRLSEGEGDLVEK